MSTLLDHIESGNWIALFTKEEIGHVLSFTYNLFMWIDRDKADKIEKTPNEFIWSRHNVVVGRFPIRVPEPEPSFIDTLLKVLQRDMVIQQYFAVSYVDNRFIELYRIESE